MAQKKKTVVLTFDDAVKSQYTLVAPLLKQYHFGATFYVCEFPGMFGDTANSLDWPDIKKISDMGFEIGNHTWHHRNLPMPANDLNTELQYIEDKCASRGIPAMHSFCYPAYHTDPGAIPILTAHGYTSARTGGDHVWSVANDDAMYVPSFTIKGDDSAFFYRAVNQAEKGLIVVLTFHGVPDNTHPWVSTPPELFARYMKYLHDNHFHVVAMKDVKIKKRK